MNNICKTKYPILLVHGLNSRGKGLFSYWGRIPDELRKNGAQVYVVYQDAWGSVESNALQLKRAVELVTEKRKCEKVNIIAHSKGGIEARYLISALGMGEKIASLTTISTPHKGVKTIEPWLKHTNIINIFDMWLNGFWTVMGDKNPNAKSAAYSLTEESMKIFNKKYIDDENVYYQSWGSEASGKGNGIFMTLTRFIFFFEDGITDGLVSPKSAMWSNYRGTIKNVSHRDITDRRKKNIKHFNTVDFYCKIVNDLAKKGY